VNREGRGPEGGGRACGTSRRNASEKPANKAQAE